MQNIFLQYYFVLFRVSHISQLVAKVVVIKYKSVKIFYVSWFSLLATAFGTTR